MAGSGTHLGGGTLQSGVPSIGTGGVEPKGNGGGIESGDVRPVGDSLFPAIWTIRESQPQIYYLPNTDGTLIPVPGFTLENFEEMLRHQRQSAHNQATVPWSIQAISATGTLMEDGNDGGESGVAERRGTYRDGGVVDLLVEFTIRTMGDELVRIPLLMDGAVFLRDESPAGVVEHTLSYEEDAGGFVCRLQGVAGKNHRLRLRFLVPLTETGMTVRFQLAMPRATYSMIQIDLPLTEGTISETSPEPVPEALLDGTSGGDTGTVAARRVGPLQVRVVESGNLLTINDGEKTGEPSQIVVRGQGGPCTLTWNRPIEQETSVGDGSVVGKIRIVVWPQGGVRFQAALRVSRRSEPLERIRVRFPKGTVLIPDAEGDSHRGYTVSQPEEISADISDCRIVEVRFHEKKIGSAEIFLTADLGYEMLIGAAAIQLSGFDVIGFPQQSGEISLLGIGDWKAVPEELVGVRQKQEEDFYADAPPAQEPNPLGSFEYYTQPFSLPVRLLSRRPHLNMSGEYAVTATPEMLRLDAVFDGNVSQAELQRLEFRIGGWTFDSMTGDGIAPGPGQVDDTGMLRIPLQRPAAGRFRLRLLAHRLPDPGLDPIRFELPSPICDATGSFMLQVSSRSDMLLIPELEKLRGMVRIGEVSLPHSVIVGTSTPVIPVTSGGAIRSGTASGGNGGGNGNGGGTGIVAGGEAGGTRPAGVAAMEPRSGADPTAEFSGSLLRYRVNPETASFTAGYRILEQRIDIFSSTELRMQANRWEVLQRFRYDVRNRPAERLFLEIPTALADQPLDVMFQGVAVVPDAVAEAEGSTTTVDRVRRRIPLPAPLLGEAELTLRYTMNASFLPDAFGRPVSIPLILPVGGEIHRQICLVRTPTVVDARLADPDWESRDPRTFREPMDFTSLWMSLPGQSDERRNTGRASGFAENRIGIAVGNATGAGSGTASEPFEPNENENLLCAVTESRRAELPIELLRNDSRETDSAVVERAWIRIWLAGNVREDRAVFLIRNGTRRSLMLELPLGVMPANVRVWLDGRIIHGIPEVRMNLMELIRQPSGAAAGGTSPTGTPAVTATLGRESNLRLVIPMPIPESAPGTRQPLHCLEVICQYPESRGESGVMDGSAGRGDSDVGREPAVGQGGGEGTNESLHPDGFSLRMPYFSDGIRVQRVFWEIVLPRNAYLLSGPSQCVPEQTYRWSGLLCERHAALNTAQLEAWSGSSMHLDTTGQVNRYLFSTVGPVTECRVWSISRSTLVICASGLILLCGLAWLHLRRIRRPETLLIAGVLVMGAIMIAPEPAVLWLTASIPGWIAIGVSVLIREKQAAALSRMMVGKPGGALYGGGRPVGTVVPGDTVNHAAMNGAVVNDGGAVNGAVATDDSQRTQLRGYPLTSEFSRTALFHGTPLGEPVLSETIACDPVPQGCGTGENEINRTGRGDTPRDTVQRVGEGDGSDDTGDGNDIGSPQPLRRAESGNAESQLPGSERADTP